MATKQKPIQKFHDSKIVYSAKLKIYEGDLYAWTPSKVALEQNPEYQKHFDHWQLVQQRLAFLRGILTRAASRLDPWEISVTLDELWEIGEKQNWKDVYSGDDLQFVSGNYESNEFACTIDRIRPNVGYVRWNVQLLTWSSNRAKGKMTDKEYLEFLDRSYKFRNCSAYTDVCI